jgi:hypothetical protein
MFTVYKNDFVLQNALVHDSRRESEGWLYSVEDCKWMLTKPNTESLINFQGSSGKKGNIDDKRK